MQTNIVVHKLAAPIPGNAQIFTQNHKRLSVWVQLPPLELLYIKAAHSQNGK
jgi:hypothetical protein